MSKYNKDEILNVLKGKRNQKEENGRDTVRFESRLEERIIEVKTDLKEDITQVNADLFQVKTDLENNIRETKTDLENNIREVKTDLKDDIKDLRNTMRTMTNLIITCGVGILAVVVTLILNIILKQ